ATPATDVLRLSGLPTTTNAGTTQTFTVVALTPNGATDTKYTGTVYFTSTDPHAVLPAKYTFTTADDGMHTFSVTLNTAGTQSITATDAALGGTTGTATLAVMASTATLLKRDTTTEGNWKGVYGSQGYNVIGNAVSYPAYANVTTS